jgi:hypothetical protein
MRSLTKQKAGTMLIGTICLNVVCICPRSWVHADFTAQRCGICAARTVSLRSQGMSGQLSTMLYAPLPAAAVARRIRNGTTNLRFFQKMQKMLKDSLPGQQ